MRVQRWLDVHRVAIRSALALERGMSTSGTKNKDAVSRALVSEKAPMLLAGAGDDVARGADLVVGHGARDGVLDAVRRRVGALDLDVLDALVVRGLQDRQRDALVAGGVVGVERLHARHGRAHVRLRRGHVRPRAEAEVRGDGDREQDAEDDDHDEELDEREALLLAGETCPQTANHAVAPSERQYALRWQEPYRPHVARRNTLDRVIGGDRK